MGSDLNFKPTLRVIDAAQVAKLHEATATILSRTGVDVTHPTAREILAGGGARVEKDRVRIPRDMLEAAIAKAPSQIVLGDRNGSPAVILEDDRSWFGATLDDVYYLDPQSRRRRQLTLDDCRKIAMLSEILPNYTWGMTFGAICDVPSHVADLYAARQALLYSQKPLVFSSNSADHLRAICDMARVFVGDAETFAAAPPVASFVTTISPLVLPDHVVDQMLYCAEHHIPQVIYNGIQTGSTAPMSLSGAVAQGNAEALACLVLIQLVKAGSPVVFGSLATIMDMRSSIFSFGAPEMNLMIAAQCQIAHHYRIPFYGTAGCSDSKLPDSQAAVEAVFSCLSSALSGANLVHDAGLLEYATMASPEHMVLVNEILHMVGQFVRGLDVSDAALALDVIDSVGPGDNYLMHEHTMQHFREVWYSQLFDRSGYDNWQEGGARDLEARVRERTLALLSQPAAPVDDRIVAALDDLCRHWT